MKTVITILITLVSSLGYTQIPDMDRMAQAVPYELAGYDWQADAVPGIVGGEWQPVAKSSETRGDLIITTITYWTCDDTYVTVQYEDEIDA